MLEKRRANWQNGYRTPVLIAALVLGVTLIAGCDRSKPTVELPEGLHPVQRADELRIALQAAQNAWSTGKRSEARAGVQTAYREWFEPIEPVLRQEDALTTLELEFQFGALAERMGSSGDPVELNDAVIALVEGLDGLVAKLPAPSPEATVEGSRSSDALPVTIEVTAPKTTLTTYGDAQDE